MFLSLEWKMIMQPVCLEGRCEGTILVVQLKYIRLLKKTLQLESLKLTFFNTHAYLNVV
jgi:hypothetical protein